MRLDPRLPIARSETVMLGGVGLLAFLGLWSGIAASGYVPRSFLPAPWEMIARFAHLLTNSFAGFTLPQHLASSLGRYGMGFGLAIAIGILLGLMMGWFRWLDDVVTPIFDALRFIAPIAWVPFAMIGWWASDLRIVRHESGD